jgi:hypothetical protein
MVRQWIRKLLGSAGYVVFNIRSREYYAWDSRSRPLQVAKNTMAKGAYVTYFWDRLSPHATVLLDDYAYFGNDSLAHAIDAAAASDVIAAIRLIHKVSQGGALAHMPGDVAYDREAQPVRHEFLDDLACDARAEPEEIIVELLCRNSNQAGSVP